MTSFIDNYKRNFMDLFWFLLPLIIVAGLSKHGPFPLLVVACLAITAVIVFPATLIERSKSEFKTFWAGCLITLWYIAEFVVICTLFE